MAFMGSCSAAKSGASATRSEWDLLLFAGDFCSEPRLSSPTEEQRDPAWQCKGKHGEKSLHVPSVSWA